MRPLLLDLFCGSGGAALGYYRAGFDVLGVDVVPQPNYPFLFWRADAIAAIRPPFAARFPEVVAVHASPPCQGYSPHVSSEGSRWAGTLGKAEPRLIAVVRSMLIESGLPYVIENVDGARSELNGPALLCGTMFGLPIPRHRLFESSFRFNASSWPRHPNCRGVAKRYAEERGWDPRDMTVTGKGRNAGTTDRWREVMGWPDTPVTQHGLREAIPPAYTEWIGTQLLALLRAAA